MIKNKDKTPKTKPEPKPVSFWNDAERERWLKLYESRVDEEAHAPKRVFDFCNEDMEIRRRVLPYDPDKSMGRLEALELAERLLDELLAQRNAEVGQTVSSSFGDDQLRDLRSRVRASRQPGDSA